MPSSAEPTRVDYHKQAFRNLGWEGYVHRMVARRMHRGTLRSKDLRHPLRFRPGTSDLRLFDDLFTEREYQTLDGRIDPGLVIDCGANVGYSSAYFLSRHPNARVIAVEPEIDNFRLLEANLSPYADRVLAIHAGVWSRPTVLSVKPSVKGDEWGCKVEEDPDGDIIAVDIPSLLSESGHDRIALLKVDIEGSEREVFSGNLDWIDATDAIAIELHGPDCAAAFYRAIEGRGFAVSEWAELTIAIRIRD